MKRSATDATEEESKDSISTTTDTATNGTTPSSGNIQEVNSNKRLKINMMSGFTKVISDLFQWKTSSSSQSGNDTLPSKILSSKGCTAQTLTVSDQHATLLLTSQAENPSEEGGANEVKSILKLTLVPFHKEILGSNPVLEPSDSIPAETNLLKNDPKASNQIISFLQAYNFKLKSESGAEYSYYNAGPSQSTPDNDAKNLAGSFDVELISPASKRQINRALPTSSTSLIEETAETYNEIVKPYIQTIVDSGSLNWIDNIIEGKKEQERLLLDHESFIINIDTKWRSHPDAFKTPKYEWYQDKSVLDLYCLGIVKQKSIASLRDLTKEHVPLLKSMKEEGLKIIEKTYGVKRDQIRVFVHYHPQFYHFHVHFTRLHNEIGSTVERGHLLSDIIQNLEMDSEYYAKRTISYKLSVTSPLYLLLKEKEQGEDQGKGQTDE